MRLRRRSRGRAPPSLHRSTLRAGSRERAESANACESPLVGRIRSMTRRPNFLVIMTDQHRADHTGFGGNEIVRTPNLDEIAARAMRFDRAIVANPICMPNRSSIVTGRLPSVHGTRTNGISLDWGANTFVRSLRERGWRTSHFGKCHLQNMGIMRSARDILLRKAAPGEATHSPWPEGWDEWEDQDRHKRE